jgi:D-alanine-D-alanine ligase
MTDPVPRVGIVFNAYEPRPVNTGERLSEESVAEMANQVHDAVKTLGCDATLIPLQRSLMNFLGRVKELDLDVLVNLCEGFYGRPQWESNVAAVFELLGMAFTGNNSRTLALCQDKYRAKAILAAQGLPTAPSQLVTSADQPLELRLPVIVKPNSEDASLGIYPESVVHDAANFAVQARRVLEKYNQPALVEAFIDGREFNVAVYENTVPEALPVSELDFSALPATSPHICSYEAKWFEDHALYNATPPICPAPIDDSLRGKLQEAAVGAFKAMGCRDYARVDFRMDGKGRLFILEVNPNPDISLNAGFARALKAANVPYESFWKTMLGNARKRKDAHDTPDVNAR